VLFRSLLLRHSVRSYTRQDGILTMVEHTPYCMLSFSFFLPSNDKFSEPFTDPYRHNINTFRTVISYLFRVQFNIILSSTHRSAMHILPVTAFRILISQFVHPPPPKKKSHPPCVNASLCHKLNCKPTKY